MQLHASSLCQYLAFQIDCAQAPTGTQAAEEAHVAALIARLEWVERLNRFFRPLLEGIAVYAELDVASISGPLPPPIAWATRIFEADRDGRAHASASDFIAQLEKQRFAPLGNDGLFDRRKVVLSSPMSFGSDAYLPGYLYIRRLRSSVPDLSDCEFLNLVVLFLLDDPTLARLIADTTIPYACSLTLIAERLRCQHRALRDLGRGAAGELGKIGSEIWDLPLEDRARVTSGDPSEIERMWRLLENTLPAAEQVGRVLDQKRMLRIGKVDVDVVVTTHGADLVVSAEPKGGSADGRQLAVLGAGSHAPGQYSATAEIFIELLSSRAYVALYEGSTRQLFELWEGDLESQRCRSIDDSEFRANFDNSAARNWLSDLRSNVPRSSDDYFDLAGVAYVRSSGSNIRGVRMHDADKVRQLLGECNVPSEESVDDYATNVYLDGGLEALGLPACSDPTLRMKMRESGLRAVFENEKRFLEFCVRDACAARRYSATATDDALKHVFRPNV